MFKVGGWLKGHAPIHTTKSLNSLDELAQSNYLQYEPSNSC